MDAYEATRVVFSRIQSLDPENAPKIMGFLLIQDNGEKEMIRLAFGPEALVYSIVLKARKELGLHGSTVSSYRQIFASSALGPLSPSLSMSPSSSSSYSSSSSSSSPPPAAAGPVFSRNGNEGIRLGSPSDKIIGPNSNTVIGTSNLVSSSSSSSSSTSLSSSSSSSSSTASSFSSSSLSSSSVQEYNYNNNNNNNNNSGPFFGEMIDEFQLQEQLSFLNEHPISIDSPNSTHSLPIGGPKNDMFYPAETESKSEDAAALFSYANWANGSLGNNGHRRSCSVADICLASEASGGSGYGWKPCLYFARGYCKNGSSCRFLHSFPDSQTAGTSELDAIVRKQQQQLEVEQYQELLTRSKSQRLASAPQLMAAAAAFPYPTAKCVLPVVQTDNYLHNCISISDNSNSNPNQRLQHNTLFLTDDDATTQKFISRSPRIERNEFGGGISTPGSRQIYLTFPADSTFREEDVSNYFSIYGPVQDVRIPYQQKRMFGFVTFVYPETVKIILAKGNPHFVCDARVLVKPYKEKGKVGDKYRKHNERGDFSGYTTPNSFDSREAYDLQLGARIFYNSQEVLRRKLEEQSDLQQAIELQGRRLMELQLLDVKKRHLPSRIMATNQFYHSTAPSTQGMSPEGIHIPAADNCPSPATATSDPRQQINYGMPQQQQQQAAVSTTTDKESSSIVDSPPKDANDYYQDSLEHNLPDSPFASPTKTVGDSYSIFSTETSATPNGVSNNLITSSLLPASPTLDMASFKSCYFQMPRFSSGPGAIGM